VRWLVGLLLASLCAEAAAQAPVPEEKKGRAATRGVTLGSANPRREIGRRRRHVAVGFAAVAAEPQSVRPAKGQAGKC